MIINISKKDVFWNIVSSLLNSGMSIIVLPFVLVKLTPAELAIWYVFAAISGLVTLVDFGFSPTITRNITYAYSGAKKLQSEGIEKVEQATEPNYSLLGSLIKASGFLYLLLSAIVCLLLLSAGTIYINNLLPVKSIEYYAAWITYIAGVFVNLYYSYFLPCLRGIGNLKHANIAMILSRLLYIAIAIIGLQLGGGLLVMSAAFFVSGFTLQVLSKTFFKGQVLEGIKKAGKSLEYTTRAILKIVWPNAKKLGITTLGAYLVLRANTLLSASYLDLNITASYGLTLQLLIFVGNLSAILNNTYIPAITSARINNDGNRFNTLLSRSMTFQWVTGILGIFALAFLGPFALRLMGSASTLLPVEMILIYGAVLFFEWNQNAFTSIIITGNSVPFAVPVLITGILTVALSFLLLSFIKLGTWSLIISQGAIQIAFNDWYWPRYVCKEMNTSVFKLFKEGAVQAVGFLKRIPPLNQA